MASMVALVKRSCKPPTISTGAYVEKSTAKSKNSLTWPLPEKCPHLGGGHNLVDYAGLRVNTPVCHHHSPTASTGTLLCATMAFFAYVGREASS